MQTLSKTHMHALRDCLHSSEVELAVKLPSDVYESLDTSGGIISSNLSNIIQLKMLETGCEMSTRLNPTLGWVCRPGDLHSKCHI